MKKLILLSTFFISISVHALPNCPSDTSLRWDNCFGTYNFANGRRDDGYFMNGEYIPDICEGMGLVKGTESFGNCVVRIIDDL